VPNEDQIKILIDPTVLAQVDAVCPSYLSRTAFINQAVDLYLNRVDTAGSITERVRQAPAQGERSVCSSNSINKRNNEKAKNQFGKKLDPEVIPAELEDCAEQILEFWAVKKGNRSEQTATRLFNKLRVMSPDDRVKALHAATDSGWASVFPPKNDAPTQGRHNHQAEPEFKHPAHQVFTAADFQ
jgi:hypothetical protein